MKKEYISKVVLTVGYTSGEDDTYGTPIRVSVGTKFIGDSVGGYYLVNGTNRIVHTPVMMDWVSQGFVE